MLRIGISVEGATEREFISKVITPYFLSHNICFYPVDCLGNISVDKVIPEIIKLLYNFDAVTTLYDFYGFKGRGTYTVDELEDLLLSRVPREKQHVFIPYVQKYEFEALVFSDPRIIANEFDQPSTVKDLIEILNKCGNAENINDGFDTCPSRRLMNIFPEYVKKLHGPIICEKIGLEKIRKHCLRFDRWLKKVEAIFSN